MFQRSQQDLVRVFSANRILFLTSIGMFLLSILFVVGIQMDTRQILGINPWIKPLKFSTSIFVYALTMIYLLQFHEAKLRENLSRKIAVTMWLEMIIIAVQSARGVQSHFNQSSPGDGVAFAIMGIAILYNTYVMGKITYGFFKSPPMGFSAVNLRAIRLGLILFMLGCFEGAFMSSRPGHTVGGVDGGPGIPFLNWSTIAGDLRIAHFLGLHGIQVLLGLCFLSYMLMKNISESFRNKVMQYILNISFVLILLMTVSSFGQALLGKSFF